MRPVYGDDGADTIGHIARACREGKADRAGLRRGPLRLPVLASLGLGEACALATGSSPPELRAPRTPAALFGSAIETSKGKDTPSGHWEIAGVPVTFDWGYFPKTQPAFPSDLIAALCARANLPGILGDRHASGTAIIAELGEAHLRTGKPICYTSADSVFQIAAHEERFGLDRLYQLCQIARELVDPLNIGRVIARPFIGSSAADFRRTPHRRDYATPPPSPTLLDCATAAGRDVVSIGKIADIFAHSGTGRTLKADGNDALFDATLEGFSSLADGGLLFSNFIDFDTIHGHRRDVAGYAAALEAFDRRLPELLASLRARRSPDHHRRSWVRSDLARNGPHARAGTCPCDRRDSRAGIDRDTAKLCRYRRHLRGSSGPPLDRRRRRVRRPRQRLIPSLSRTPILHNSLPAAKSPAGSST